MTDHALRGSRIGAHTLFTTFDGELEPRHEFVFRCAEGHQTTVTFAAEADIPAVWTCRTCGAEAERVEGDHLVTHPDGKSANSRTPWDMLRERRSIPELEEILDERLEYLRDRRRKAVEELTRLRETSAVVGSSSARRRNVGSGSRGASAARKKSTSRSR